MAMRSAGTRAGALAYWGPTIGDHLTPKELLEPGTVLDISVGFRHTLVLRPDWSVTAFGSNEYGQATPPEATQVSGHDPSFCLHRHMQSLVPDTHYHKS